MFFSYLIRLRRWRWQVGASTPPNRNLTLRELLGFLKAHRGFEAERASYLQRLISLVEADVKSSQRFPLRRGSPDTPRTLGVWKSRYNNLDWFISPHHQLQCSPSDQSHATGPDSRELSNTGSAEALSAAENEGWPSPGAGVTSEPKRH